MRILVVSTSVVPVGALRYGGIEKMAYDLAAGLARAGQQVSMAAPAGSDMPPGVSLLETVNLPQEQDRDDIAYSKYMDADFDVYHDFSHGHAMGQKGNCPAAYMLWDPVVFRYPKAKYNICCVSEWQAERFVRLYRQDAKVFPKYGWVGPEYRPVQNPTRERFLHIGKISPEKGALQAIQMAKACAVGLDIVGGLIPSDSQEFYQSLVKYDDGVNIRIHFNATEAEKVELMQNAKAVIYPQQFDEAHSLVAIEAAQCHTPMVCYARGALPTLGIANCVQSEAEFLNAIRTIDDWFVPSDVDWSVDARSETYLGFYKEIARGLRW
ncbi:MAG TPA: glycosyltransferase [Nitrososphaerales archaeon]|nr:glycosyltransferase [Nitrososphaerales archaeon]